MANKLIISDLDDTLIPTEQAYVDAQFKFIEWVYSRGNILDKALEPYYLAQKSLALYLREILGHRAPNFQTVLQKEFAFYESRKDFSTRHTYDSFQEAFEQICSVRKHDVSVAEMQHVDWIAAQALEAGNARSVLPVTPGRVDVRTFMDREESIDAEGVKGLGFTAKRFPTTFQKAYLEVCNKFNLPWTKEDLDTVYKIGHTAFDPDQYARIGFIPGAVETLEFLISQGDELVMATKGDVEVQNSKIDGLNLRKWFGDRIRIVPKKSPEILNDIAKGRDPSQVYHLGNSIPSDVEPALAAGHKVWYVPCETWAYEMQHKGVPDDPKVTTFHDISEIKERYKEFG